MSPPVSGRPPGISRAQAWSVVRKLLPYLWPRNATDLRLRVLAAAFLLVCAKLTNVYVPLLYKHAVDALADPRAQLVAVPIVLTLASRVARILAQALIEL